MRQIRARFGAASIRVYQAYSPPIADAALAAQTFVPPFKRERMTWIKPSFTWMMYRSGWGTKEGQERVLGIDIARAGFEWALCHACLSHFEPDLDPDEKTWSARLRTSPVRVQWDPERALTLQPLPWRSLQVGLSGRAVALYIDEWIMRIEDVTELAVAVAAAVRSGNLDDARHLAPREAPYPLPESIARRLKASVPGV